MDPHASQGTRDTTPKGPSETTLEDPQILLDASEILDNVQTPEGDAANISDFILSEERKGDNINGNKELRKNGDDEDENSSKRAKGPLTTETP